MEILNVQQQPATASQLMEEALLATGVSPKERKARPRPEQTLKCPRCGSTNTKFCYYNNYSLSQPRYFCKGCRRYWTHGGSLRNVPIGGGCRKNKRSKSSSTLSTTSSSSSHHHHLISPNSIDLFVPTFPSLSYEPSDLSLTPFLLGSSNPNPNPSITATGPAGFLDILRSGFLDSQGNSIGFNNLCSYPFDGSLSPFDGGLRLNSAITATTSASALETGFNGDQNGTSINNNDRNSNNVGKDQSERDHWNIGAGGSCNWYGVTNGL